MKTFSHHPRHLLCLCLLFVLSIDVAVSQWTWAPLPNHPRQRVVGNDSILFYAFREGIFQSTDAGLSWERRYFDSTLTYPGIVDNPVFVFGNLVFVQMDNALLRSDDGGVNFQIVLNTEIQYMDIIGDSVLLAYKKNGTSTNSGIFYGSSDAGLSWNAIYSDPITQTDVPGSIQSIRASNDRFYAVSNHPHHLIFILDTAFNMTVHQYIYAYFFRGREVFEMGDTLLMWTTPQTTSSAPLDTSFHFSVDSGATWQAGPDLPNGHRVKGLDYDGTTFYAGTADGLFTSPNPISVAWQYHGPIPLPHKDSTFYSLAVIEGDLYATYGEYPLIKTTDLGASWETVFDGIGGPSSFSLNQISVLDSFWMGLSRGIRPTSFSSTDQGDSWNVSHIPELYGLNTTQGIESIMRISDSVIVAVAGPPTSGDTYFRTADNGQSWSSSLFAVKRIAKHGPFTMAYSGILSISLDEGLNFQISAFNGSVIDVWANDTVIFAATYEGIYHSLDSGANWTFFDVPNNLAWNASQYPFIAAIDNRIYFSYQELYMTEDFGASYQIVDSSWGNYSLVSASGQLFRSNVFGIAWSQDSGQSWIDIGGNLTDGVHFSTPGYGSLQYIKPYLFVQRSQRGLAYRQIEDLPCLGNGAVECHPISGRVYLEDSLNCVYDGTEAPATGHVLEITPGPQYVYPGQDGQYSFQLSTGLYNFRILPQEYYEWVCPADSTEFTQVQITGPYTLNLGLVESAPDSQIVDVNVSIICPAPPNPNFPVCYDVLYYNLGTDTATGVIEFLYDNQELIFLPGLSTGVSSIGDSLLRWSLDSLPLHEARLAHLCFTPLGSLGDSIQVQANALVDSFEINPLDNFRLRTDVLVGSYDPNDKLVEPDGDVPPGTDQFTYTIRFQNTGTDTAYFVQILDTLDSQLDPLSIRPLGGSHAYQFDISPEGNPSWTFPNILLPDSGANLQASQGYVLFEIQTDEPMVFGDTIRNGAAIYFDSNEPVITPEVISPVGLPDTLVHDTLVLKAGWNLISFDVFPDSQLISAVFSAAHGIDSANLIHIAGFDGATLTYDPTSTQNSLQKIRLGGAYWVKVTTPDTLLLSGHPIPVAYQGLWNQGWNLIAYLPQQSTTPENFFSSYIADGSLAYLIGFDEGIQIFDPSLPTYLNTLTSLENGKGYWIKTTQTIGAKGNVPPAWLFPPSVAQPVGGPTGTE
ncbi:MAG: hypothetical protein AAF587_26105 [Bacteroidota bacterium]